MTHLDLSCVLKNGTVQVLYVRLQAVWRCARLGDRCQGVGVQIWVVLHHTGTGAELAMCLCAILSSRLLPAQNKPPDDNTHPNLSTGSYTHSKQIFSVNIALLIGYTKVRDFSKSQVCSQSNNLSWSQCVLYEVQWVKLFPSVLKDCAILGGVDFLSEARIKASGMALNQIDVTKQYSFFFS